MLLLQSKFHFSRANVSLQLLEHSSSSNNLSSLGFAKNNSSKCRLYSCSEENPNAQRYEYANKRSILYPPVILNKSVLFFYILNLRYDILSLSNTAQNPTIHDEENRFSNRRVLYYSKKPLQNIRRGTNIHASSISSFTALPMNFTSCTANASALYSRPKLCSST